MMKSLLFTVFTGLLFFSLSAQTPRNCGMTHEDEKELAERVKLNKELLKSGVIPESRGEITYVPIKFHIMANSGGFGGVTEETLFSTLCRINDDYREQDIQFFMEDGFNYINNTTAFENPSSSAGEFQLALAKNNFFGRVNVFVCLNAGNIANVGVTAGYYRGGQSDWIVLRKSNTGYSDGTLTHELAHYFSVMHVFYGWDGNPYNPDVHSNPAPATSSNGHLTENMDRTGSCKNCDIAGDFLCDTNPDYLLSQFYSNGNCTYTGNIMDPCGELVVPAKENYMSYFFGCDEVFSPQQKDLIRADLTTRRNGGIINKSFVPNNTNTIEEFSAVPVNPINQEQLDYNETVYLAWENVPHATHYIVEVDKFISFTVDVKRYFTWYPGITLEDLDPNQQYYWKIIPYNDVSSCQMWSDAFSFTTGEGATSVQNIDEIVHWGINPNPANANSEIFININAKSSINADISILDITGKQVKQINQDLIKGENRLTLNTNNMNAGIYIVSIQSEGSVLTRKLIVD